MSERPPVTGRTSAVLAEVALIAVIALVEIGGASLVGGHSDVQPSLGVAGVVLLGLGIAALPFRHRYPVAVLAVVFGTTLAYWALGYTRGPIWLALIVALVEVVFAGRRWVAVISLVAGFLAFPWLGYLVGRADRPSGWALFALGTWLVALISLAEAVRYRRERAAEAARSETEALRRQVSDERLRMARELHDVVAHNMSLISIQAGVALHLMDTDPDHAQIRTSLATIKEASKEALVELRSILGVLRSVDEEFSRAGASGASGGSDAVGGSGAPGASGASGPEADGAPRAPVPSLRRLDELTERARATGLEVEVTIGAGVGDLAALPRRVDLAAFRIVQESLTNVARHSDSPMATVRLDREDEGLTVDVLDEGSGSPRQQPGDLPPGGGNGLPGMRERAALVGGRVEAGPRPGRGFAVHAWLPLAHPPGVLEAERPLEGQRSSKLPVDGEDGPT